MRELEKVAALVHHNIWWALTSSDRWLLLSLLLLRNSESTHLKHLRVVRALLLTFTRSIDQSQPQRSLSHGRQLLQRYSLLVAEERRLEARLQSRLVSASKLPVARTRSSESWARGSISPYDNGTSSRQASNKRVSLRYRYCILDAK